MLKCPYCSNVVPLMRSVRGHFKSSRVSPLSVTVSTLCCSKPVRFTSRTVNVGSVEYPQHRHELVMLAMPLEEAGKDFWGDDYGRVKSGDPRDDLMQQSVDLYSLYPYVYYTRNNTDPHSTEVYSDGSPYEGEQSPTPYRTLML